MRAARVVKPEQLRGVGPKDPFLFLPGEEGSSITRSTVRSRSYQGKSVPSMMRWAPMSWINRASSSAGGAFGPRSTQ
jgi:hypothetical protein